MDNVSTDRRAHFARHELNASTVAAADTPIHRINPEFSVTRNGYHVRVVPTSGHLRDRVDHLVATRYASRGLATDEPIATSRHSGEVVLAACRGDWVFGTLTVRNDVGNGLLADALYQPQIESVRGRGGRVCEVGRLAMDPEHNGQEALATLFQVGFLVARYACERTDCFIEVHPRHADFYAHMLGFRQAGDEATCPRVGAPAVLMHLPLAEAERHATLRDVQADDGKSRRNLYRQFLPVQIFQTMTRGLLRN